MTGERAARRSMACPALPTCGLALAESERMLPGLVDRIEKLCAEVGPRSARNIIRSPAPERLRASLHGRDRLRRKSPGRYQLWLGGNTSGTRLNRVFKDVVKDPEIEAELRPLLLRFAKERNKGERLATGGDRTC